MEKIIDVENLKKSFEDIKAVDDLTFYVEKGQLFAFLGTNGAGKSTTIDMLCTLLEKDSGYVTIDGLPLGKKDADIRKLIGIVFQDSVMDNVLTVKENLQTRARFYGSENVEERINKACESADALEFLNRPYGKLSGGQRRRADIARALINTPKILFLDEPTTGLDPKSRKNVYNTITKLREDYGVTVFLTTHYMEEAADADYVVVIGKGKILAKGTPFELKNEFSKDSLNVKANDSNLFIDYLKKNKYSYLIKNDYVKVELKKTIDSLKILKDNESNLSGFEVLTGTMDDAFINITGGEIADV